jgi:hypothetical protein
MLGEKAADRSLLISGQEGMRFARLGDVGVEALPAGRPTTAGELRPLNTMQPRSPLE